VHTLHCVRYCLLSLVVQLSFVCCGCCQLRLGSTADNDEVGRLVVDMLCPAIHAILLDGLRPHIRSFFGRVKNSAWKVVEDSVELGQWNNESCHK